MGICIFRAKIPHHDYLISYDETGNKEDLKKAIDFVSKMNEIVNTP